jgi:hypothetical protein
LWGGGMEIGKELFGKGSPHFSGEITSLIKNSYHYKKSWVFYENVAQWELITEF